MLTSPVAAARAVVATGAWVKSKHDMYLKRGSVGALALFLPSAGGLKKIKRIKILGRVRQMFLYVRQCSTKRVQVFISISRSPRWTINNGSPRML